MKLCRKNMANQHWSDISFQIAILCVLIITCWGQQTSEKSSNPTCCFKEAPQMQYQENNGKENLAIASLLERLESAEKKIENQAAELANTKNQLNQALDILDNIDEASLSDRLESAERKIANQESELDATKTQLAKTADDMNQVLVQLSNINEGEETRADSLFIARGLANYELHTKIYNANETMIYRNIVTNPGGHYNPTTGEYTCPVTGVYFFSFSILGQDIQDGHKISRASATLRREGTEVGKVYFSNENIQRIDLSLAKSNIMLCSKGNRVWVQSDYNKNKIYGRNRYSNFNGILLYET